MWFEARQKLAVTVRYDCTLAGTAETVATLALNGETFFTHTPLRCSGEVLRLTQLLNIIAVHSVDSKTCCFEPA